LTDRLDMTTTNRSGPEPDGEPEYARQLGARLRAIREQRGWSLHDVQVASEARFTGSAVGTYERGERSISVRRLAELASLYGVPLDRVLPGTPERGSTSGTSAADEGTQPGKVVIDLIALERRHEPELELIRHYLDAIMVRRGDYNGRVLTVRAADVWAMAAMCTTDTADLVHSLEHLEVLQHR
jgi:transcriptional regulator with XRE-family HTH domain